MSFLRLSLVSGLFVTLAAGIIPSVAAQKPAYKGAIVVDALSGKVLFEDNPDLVNPPASITKLMTFLIVHDQLSSGALNLQTEVPVSAASSRIGGTQVWLKHGESFSVEEMLYALMIQSANDCAHALASLIGGTPDEFVEMMNARARQLGMTNTTFRSPHGLPTSNRRIADGDLTSPRDLSLLSRHLLLHTDVLKYSSIKVRDFRTDATKGRIVMRNHNHLLERLAGVDGLKTGYTRGAGFCLAATASRNGRRVIAVSMGSPSGKVRDLKMAELLAKGFANLPAIDSPLSVAPLASPVLSANQSPIQMAPPERNVMQEEDAALEDDSPPVIIFKIRDL
ncbi:MAG: D-alanyl-D-alanine carboxypeptidase [Opitutaceae bacterium]|nr:D-alanyl-D-alanine carboxypeptidase [Opitutaceae bacterium]